MNTITKSLSHEIKDIGKKIGFTHIGITSPDIGEWEVRLRNWVNQCYHGEMQFLSRGIDRRTDIASSFPDVKSVVVASMNYFSGEGHRKCLDDPSIRYKRGYIANYALNEDYHPVIEARLRELMEEINRLTDGRAKGKIYVDAGPVPEKALAVKAGIGWVGKHSIIVSKDAGSWLLLGVLLLDIELDFDEPATDHCGNCTKCIEACPTNAIIEPYVVDARRCISYLLGELKGDIPAELRPLIGNRIFGCDDCQWVCPKNKTARVSSEKAFQPREDLSSPLLEELIDVSEDRFNTMFNNNPIKRIKWKRFKRNVENAIKNETLLSLRLTKDDEN
ncbi:MAG: tRNA epoxyqueuosine(34) reductase QueG [Nitrospirae bacterium]|nr:tRNA epoxyqueuosine(34) reductase QueG [Nitrospirota bacterium]